MLAIIAFCQSRQLVRHVEELITQVRRTKVFLNAYSFYNSVICENVQVFILG